MGPAMLMCQLNGPISNKRTTIGLQSTHITNLYKSCNIYFAFGKVNRFSTFPMALWSLFKTLHKFKKKVMCSHDKLHILQQLGQELRGCIRPMIRGGTSQHWCCWTANNYRNSASSWRRFDFASASRSPSLRKHCNITVSDHKTWFGDTWNDHLQKLQQLIQYKQRKAT